MINIYFRQYPGNDNLLQMLMNDPIKFEKLLESSEIQLLVDKLWKCEYQWTFNIFNTSTASFNLEGPWFFSSNLIRF